MSENTKKKTAFVKVNNHAWTPGRYNVLLGHEEEGTGVVIAQTSLRETAEAIANAVNKLDEVVFNAEVR